MSMLKRLKSIFIVEEEEKFVMPKKGSAEQNVPVADSLPLNTEAQASEKFVNSLLKAIEANNLEGFDYLEYKQSLKSLASMEMDEETKFNSAFAMAKTMGASKNALIESANHYLKILKTEEGKFNDAYQKQQQKQVVERQEKLKLTENSIKKKEEQIKRLQEEIKASKIQLELKQKEIDDAAVKVGQTRDQFLASYNKVSEQISVDIERMNKYLTK